MVRSVEYLLMPSTMEKKGLDILDKKIEEISGAEKAKIIKKTVEVAPAILFEWAIYYINTAGFRRYVSRCNKEGRHLVAIIRGRGPVILEEPREGWKIVKIGTSLEDRIQIMSKAVMIKVRDVQPFLVGWLASKHRVPKSAISFYKKTKVLLASSILFEFIVGEGKGTLRISDSGSHEMKWDPLADEIIQRLAIQEVKSLFKKSTRSESLQMREKSKITKAGASRSWDVFFKKKEISDRKVKLLKSTQETKVLSSKVLDNTSFVLVCQNEKIALVGINRFTGSAKIKILLPKRNEILNLVAREVLSEYNGKTKELTQPDSDHKPCVMYCADYYFIIQEKGPREYEIVTPAVALIDNMPFSIPFSINLLNRKITLDKPRLNHHVLHQFVKDKLGIKDFEKLFKVSYKFPRLKLKIESKHVYYTIILDISNLENPRELSSKEYQKNLIGKLKWLLLP
ncbi:TPA: hypothetical protein EYP70_07215 [Candidatus Bathyarchaeota archaeon]|nr:hypothetical protein [Candidatus Bathyarchaeota archaeon]